MKQPQATLVPAAVEHARRVLPVDWVDLEIAFRDATGAASYLDLENGDVVMILKGFDDEQALQEKLKRYPQRYVNVPTLQSDFTRAALSGFIARMPPSATQKKLAALKDGPGALAESMAILKGDKAAHASFSRFEQGELWRCVEAWLVAENITAQTPAPAVELFE